MNRPVSLRAYCGAAGYTLVEMLVATALTLMLMGAVVAMFGRVSEGITDSRAMLEAAERLRLAETRLQMDLSGVTVTLANPWCRPENNLGYFEYIEGPIVGSVNVVDPVTNAAEPMLGDYDDVLMFTTRSSGRPFVGRSGAGTIQSDVAEVAWFVRKNPNTNMFTLYRRMLLVAPGASVSGTDCDVSKPEGTSTANTLGDLTKRECRFAHNTTTFPFAAVSPLPTLSDTNQMRADDVVLTNVIGFDVKAWDPGAGAYVDLGGTTPVAAVTFAGNGQPNSGLATGTTRVYSTWPTHYEYVGTSANDSQAGRAVNGFDDDNNGIIDDANELITAPPYPYPLRGIQVKIRVFEPDSQQVREVTVVQDFLP